MESYYFQMDELSVGYNGKPLIEHINIGVKKGEIVTLIGPNGSGKSTILKSITRQLRLLGGRVSFDEQNIHQMSYREMSTKMAVVLTERMRPELMTCHDIVATGRYPYTGRLGILSREDEKKVEEAMCAVHARELGSRDFNAISDGQRQRVLLARAICQEPEVIVLDEPTAMLDPKGRAEVISTVTKLCREKGITVVLITHHMSECIGADRVIVMSNGNVIADDSPENVFSQVELMKSEGLTVPATTELMFELNKNGWDLPLTALGVSDCAKEIAKELK